MSGMRGLGLKVPPPVVMIVFAWLMWLAARSWPALDLALPARGRIALAVVIAACGLALGAAAIRTMRRARTTLNPMRPANATALVESGVYRFTRNPIYLSDALILLAWAAWLANPLSLLLLIVFVAWIDRLQIAAEERALRELFGGAFERYCSRVRRWI